MHVKGFGGQSAPPSLKEPTQPTQSQSEIPFRGAVRPPFIEGVNEEARNVVKLLGFGGQSAPPSLKVILVSPSVVCLWVSGGSPPPLH